MMTKVRIKLRVLMGIPLILLFFLTANFSASRAAMIGAPALILLGVGIASLGRFSRVGLTKSISILLGGIAVLVIGGFALIRFGDPAYAKEVEFLLHGTSWREEVGGRFFQVESAVAMWKEYPIYGVGGWGYRYLASHYLPYEFWAKLNIGKANVHNDFFQYLAEFGLLGVGLLTAVFFPWFRESVRRCFRKPGTPGSLWSDPFSLMLTVTLAMVITHSMIDLPFRSPALMIHTVVLWWLIVGDPSQNKQHVERSSQEI